VKKNSSPHDEAIKIDPDNIQLLVYGGIYLSDKMGSYNHAISLYNKLVKANQNNVQAPKH